MRAGPRADSDWTAGRQSVRGDVIYAAVSPNKRHMLRRPRLTLDGLIRLISGGEYQ